jgi:uncharacterized protein YkwD
MKMYPYIALLLVFGFVVYFFSKQVLSIQYPQPTPTPIPTATPRPYIPPAPVDLDDRYIWDMIQNWREQENLPKYIEHQGLCKLAEKRVEQIKKEFKHITFSDADFKLAGVTGTISENIISRGSEYVVLQGWLESPSHAAALRKKDFTRSCLVCSGEMCAQLFTY